MPLRLRETTVRNHERELLVIGGGIGGLAAALAAARAGRSVRVLEKAPSFTELGAGIQLAPNATRLLAAWGLLDRIVDAGVLPRRLVLGSAVTGKELTTLNLDDGFRGRYGAPYVVLHRSDLLDALADACREQGVALEPGTQVDDVANTDDGVAATCSDGRVYRGAAAIGADGLHSRVRRLVSDDGTVFSGYVAYRGAVPVDQATRLADLGDMIVWIGPGLHFVQYALRGGEMYNQVAVFRSDRYLAGRDDWGTPDELDERFSGTCEHVREAMQALWRDQWWEMHDREPIGNWTSGRITLLGDAAHPMLQYLAQGACQALEDAACLGAHLSDPGVPVVDALCAYQAARIPRTAEVQRNARLWGDIWHVDGVGALLRDALLADRAVDDYRYIDWLYAHEVTSADSPVPP